MQVMNGKAEKNKGGKEVPKRCGWCKQVGHRNSAANPCPNAFVDDPKKDVCPTPRQRGRPPKGGRGSSQKDRNRRTEHELQQDAVAASVAAAEAAAINAAADVGKGNSAHPRQAIRFAHKGT